MTTTHSTTQPKEAPMGTSTTTLDWHDAETFRPVDLLNFRCVSDTHGIDVTTSTDDDMIGALVVFAGRTEWLAQDADGNDIGFGVVVATRPGVNHAARAAQHVADRFESIR